MTNKDLKNGNDHPQKRWSLVFGIDEDDKAISMTLSDKEIEINDMLSWLYGKPNIKHKKRQIAIGNWIEKINATFPSQMAHQMNRDALEKYGIELLLSDDHFLAKIEPDVQIVATLLELIKIIPDNKKHIAQSIISKIADQLTKELSTILKKDMSTSIFNQHATRKTKFKNVLWDKTIIKNLKNYSEITKTIVPEVLIGKQAVKKVVNHIYILLDQSGSMSSSVIYASLYACIFKKISSIRTDLVLFDSEIVDMTNQLDDPIDLLFSLQLSSTTAITKALKYALQNTERPENAILILISDLEENVDTEENLYKIAQFAKNKFRHFITILSMGDEGDPTWNIEHQKKFQQINIPTIACSPHQFPSILYDVMKT